MLPVLVRGGKRTTHVNEHEEVAEVVSNLLAVFAPDMTELAGQLQVRPDVGEWIESSATAHRPLGVPQACSNGGRLYDRFTGPAGLPVQQYMQQFTDWRHLDWDF